MATTAFILSLMNTSQRKHTLVNSISNTFASGALPLPIPLRAALIDCISSSHFFTSSRACSSVIGVAIESGMMVYIQFNSFV